MASANEHTAANGHGQVKILSVQDEQWDEFRVGRVFNKRRPDRHPNAIALPTTVDEVIQAVKLAKSKGWKIAVRSGGHSWAAWGVRDGSMLIDLDKLRQLDYDPSSQVARASPSFSGRQVNHLLSQHGVWFPGGHCPDVGIGGFLLQGGSGWNNRNYGWACSMVDHIDVVTANGDLVRCSAFENGDLFWAAFGSGPGFFGVVVRFGLKARPAVKGMYHTTYIFPGTEYDHVFKWYLDIAPLISPLIELAAIGFQRKRIFPDGDPTEPILVLRATAHAPDKETALAALKVWETCPYADKAYAAEVSAATSLAEEYRTQERDNPKNGRYWVDNAWLTGSNANITTSSKRAFVELPTPDGFTLHLSYAPDRPVPANLAFDMQTDHYLASYIIDDTPNPTDATATKCAQWIQSVFADLDTATATANAKGDDEATRTVGLYLGDSDLTQRPARFMSEAHWLQWVQIRDKWDPDRRFVGFLAGDKWPLNWNSWEPKPAKGRPQ